MSKVYWTMKNGQKIDIDEMDINHLRNTLKMIVRNHQKNTKRNKILTTKELEFLHEDQNFGSK